MTRRLPMLSLFLVLAVLAACDDPTEPLGYCDTAGNCGVEGVDLAIVEAELVFDEDQIFRSQVDAHAVEPGDELTLKVRVVNRGTADAPAARIAVTDALYEPISSEPIPALEPGEERVIEVDFSTPVIDAFPELLYEVYATLITETTNWFDDADYANNFADGIADLVYHPLVPILQVELSAVPDTVLSDRPYVLTATITNLSHFVAADDVEFGLCVYPGNVECTDAPDGPLMSTGSIAPGDSRVVAAGLETRHFYFDPNHAGVEASVGACFAGPEGWGDGIRCSPTSWADIVIVPNLAEVCDAPLLTPTATIESRDPAAACSPDGPGTPSHYMWAIDLDAGEQVRFTLNDDLTDAVSLDIFTVDTRQVGGGNLHSPHVFTAPADGRYYVVASGGTSREVLVELL